MSYHSKSLKPKDFVQTPSWLLEFIKRFFGEFFDPCPHNPTFDGLHIGWNDLNYVNPPYSQKEVWIRKAIHESERGKKVILLLPVDTTTDWFLRLDKAASNIRFLSPRLKFTKGSPWFGSMLVFLHIALDHMSHPLYEKGRYAIWRIPDMKDAITLLHSQTLDASAWP